MINFKVYFKYIKLKMPPIFRIRKQRVEYRKDPLTEDICRINVDRATRPFSYNEDATKEQEKEIEFVDENCVFCRKNIFEKTPRFERVVSNQEYIKYNDFVMFPNLYPFAQIHSIGVITPRHFIPYSKITKSEWENAIYTAIAFLKAQANFSNALLHPSINFNFLMPAGASLLHPHIQIIADEMPTNYVKKILDKAKEFKQKNKVNYFEELMLQDKQRLIYKNNNLWFKAKFAPLAEKEIIGVLMNKYSFEQINDSDISCICEGIVKILNAYQKIGVESINMSIFSAPICKIKEENEKYDFFNIIIRIIARPKLIQNYTTDRGFMEILQQTPVISTMPENLAAEMKKHI